MVDTKVANASCTYPSNVFYINVSIISSTNNFLNGKSIFKHNLYANLWNQMDSTILNGQKPLMTNNITSFRKPFYAP